MKPSVPAAVLAAVLPFSASAQALPELPSLGAAKAALAEGSDVPAAAGMPAADPLAAKKACRAWTPTAKVGRGLFAEDYTIEVDGSEIGEIERRGDAYVLLAKGGAVEATATLAGKGDRQTATITDCNGVVKNQVEELIADGQSAFNIRDAAGGMIMSTGWVSDGDMSARAPGDSASLKVVQNGILDNFTVTIKGPATPVGLFAAVMNNAAAYRRSRERDRDRASDRPGRDR
jgi:hypothetical protein